MILLTQTDGRQIRGEIEKDLGDELIFNSEVGRLIIKKSDIVDQKDILNCTRFPVGTYVRTGDAIYLKIGDMHFRLVKNFNGEFAQAIDIDRIDFGEVMTHEEVFAPEEEVVLPEEPEPLAEPEA